MNNWEKFGRLCAALLVSGAEVGYLGFISIRFEYPLLAFLGGLAAGLIVAIMWPIYWQQPKPGKEYEKWTGN